MSTQSEREAAARAWWKDPSHDTAQALAEATRAVYAYACPQEGTLGTMLGALSLWMKWCREDAAKAAPAQSAALTLEQARAMCREAGDTLVTASGYERPDLVLAALEAFKRIDVRDMPRVRGAIANCEWVQEAKALCDLGVTPAVLS